MSKRCAGSVTPPTSRHAFFSPRENQLISPLVRATGRWDSSTAGRARRLSSRRSATVFTTRSTRFDVSLAPDEPARILRVESTPGDLCGWGMESFSPFPGFVAAIVIERAPSGHPLLRRGATCHMRKSLKGSLEARTICSSSLSPKPGQALYHEPVWPRVAQSGFHALR